MNNIENVWRTEHVAAFDALKNAPPSTHVLGFADNNRPFVLETDASHEGLGAILSQEQDDGKVRVITYASRRLRPAERNAVNYSSMKLEMLALKWAVADKFRHYLIGGKFSVITDNNPLVHFKTAKVGALEQRWAAELALDQGLNDLGYEHYGLVKSDDAKYLVLIPQSDLVDDPSGVKMRDHLSANIQKSIGRIGKHLGNVRIAQVRLSTRSGWLTKAHGYGECPLPTLNSHVATTFANCHSSCAEGTVHFIPYLMACSFTQWHIKFDDPKNT